MHTITRKPNRYAGICENCGRAVGEGEGYLVGKHHARGAWLIAHTDCEISEAAVRSDIAEARKALTPDPANIDEAIAALCEEHIMLAEIDNIFEPGSDIEIRHLAEMGRINTEIARLEAMKG
jgi:hypothetical protein